MLVALRWFVLVFGLSLLVPRAVPAKDIDLTGRTQHPDLYLSTTDISAEGLKREPCTAASPGAARPGKEPSTELKSGTASHQSAQYAQPRFQNFVPLGGAAPGDPTHWTAELEKTPTTHGTYEVTIHPCETANAEQTQEAQALLDASLDSALRHGWFDKKKALADGYRIHHHGEHVHFVNPSYLTDGVVLDPDKPEFLVFFEEDGIPELAGFMYVMEGLEDRGPQVGGPLTIWHYHVMHPMCMKDGLTAGTPNADGVCAEGERTIRSPEMLHTWFWKRHDGPFSSDMSSPNAKQNTDHHQHGKHS